MYLKNRDPFPLNLTPYLSWKKHADAAKNEQVKAPPPPPPTPPPHPPPPVPIHATPFLCSESCPHVLSSGRRCPWDCQATRSADLVVAAVRFHRSLEAQALNPDVWRMQVPKGHPVFRASAPTPRTPTHAHIPPPHPSPVLCFHVPKVDGAGSW
jgi:hypothetical protein